MIGNQESPAKPPPNQVFDGIRILDLDHVGAHVAEEHRQVRTGNRRAMSSTRALASNPFSIPSPSASTAINTYDYISLRRKESVM
jgi:hypothetical protein